MNPYQELTSLLHEFFQAKYPTMLTAQGAFVRGVNDMDEQYLAKVQRFAIQGYKINWTQEWEILEQMLWTKAHREILASVMSGPRFGGV